MPHLDDAYGLARSLTGNPTDAEDVVQDACLRALNSVRGYAGGNARAWVLAIVRNAAFDHMARNRAKSLVFTDDMATLERATPLAGDCATPETELIQKADSQQFEVAMAALPLSFRETLALREIHGLSYREISEVTQSPVGTVMSRLARARSLMIASLQTPAGKEGR